MQPSYCLFKIWKAAWLANIRFFFECKRALLRSDVGLLWLNANFGVHPFNGLNHFLNAELLDEREEAPLLSKIVLTWMTILQNNKRVSILFHAIYSFIQSLEYWRASLQLVMIRLLFSLSWYTPRRSRCAWLQKPQHIHCWSWLFFYFLRQQEEYWLTQIYLMLDSSFIPYHNKKLKKLFVRDQLASLP